MFIVVDADALFVTLGLLLLRNNPQRAKVIHFVIQIQIQLGQSGAQP